MRRHLTICTALSLNPHRLCYLMAFLGKLLSPAVSVIACEPANELYCYATWPRDAVWEAILIHTVFNMFTIYLVYIKETVTASPTASLDSVLFYCPCNELF